MEFNCVDESNIGGGGGGCAPPPLHALMHGSYLTVFIQWF